MFFAESAVAEKYDYLAEKFRVAYKWLNETDLSALPVGSYPLVEGQVTANVQEYETLTPDQARFETHEKFFDIQYVVSGIESFGVCKREGLKVSERVEENDVIFYEDPEFSGNVILKPGDLIVVAPEDAHKPRCQAGASCPVKKVVIKVAI